MIGITVFIIFFFVMLCNVKQYFRFKKMINTFPGEKGHWFFGDVWEFGSDSAKNFQIFRKRAKQFPNGYRLWSVPGIAGVCITSPEQAEILLSSAKHIKKSIIYKFIQPWLKTGLLTSTGKKWAQRRKLLTPAFHFNILKRLTEPFEEHNNFLIELLNKECENTKTNIVPIISHVALNLICDTSMGVKLEPDNENQMEYRKAIYGFNLLLRQRIVRPWYFSDFIYQFSSLYQCQKKILKMLHAFTRNIIKKRETSYSEEEMVETSTYPQKRLAMLDLLLYAKNRKGEIDDDGINEEVDTFTFEGHDTVSMALCFALLVLANEQEHQSKIMEELDDLFEGSDRPATYQDLHNMPYLEMCLKECLRLFPSVSLISRYVEEDVPLDEKLIIPAGTIVHLHIFDIHRNEKHFGNPDKFIPKRFSPENSRSRHPFAYIPFSAGPRNCIGQKYAMLELKSIVSCILRHFKLVAVDKIDDVALCVEMVLRSQNGINIKFVSRNK